MFEYGLQDKFDRVIVVTADLKVRLARAMKRDNLSMDLVLAKIDKQIPDEEKIKDSSCSYVLVNNGDENQLEGELIPLVAFIKDLK